MQKWKFAVPLVCFMLVGGALGAQEGTPEADVSHLVPVYKVTITNITGGQIFAPIVVATHEPGGVIFRLGREASPPLEVLAETGHTDPLVHRLRSLPEVKGVRTTNAMLRPGESATLRVRTGPGFHHVSVASMMVPTNDGFLGLSDVRGPVKRPARTYISPGYDAGTELNDELCASIPGPDCGGNGGEDEEGVVHIHSGIHGIGDLQPFRRDWKNPVARIHIRRELIDPAELEPES